MASLSGFQVYADRFIRPRLTSQLYKRIPLLSVTAGKAGTQGKIGRPGTFGIIGGRLSEARRQTLDGSEAAHVRFVTGLTGGGKNLPARGTGASTGNTSQDQKVKTANFKWTVSQ